MRFSSFILILLLLYLSVGCASTQDASSGDFTFKTKTVPANFGLSSNSYSGTVTVLYQAQAKCEGVNCVPDQVELLFRRESSFNTLYLNNRNLTIRAGNQSYEWKEAYRPNINETQRVVGVIKSVILDWDQFVQIATSYDVTGNLAGENFKWTYENRAPLRTLLSEIESKNANAR